MSLDMRTITMSEPPVLGDSLDGVECPSCGARRWVQNAQDQLVPCQACLGSGRVRTDRVERIEDWSMPLDSWGCEYPCFAVTARWLPQ